jgi:hypothetical protein
MMTVDEFADALTRSIASVRPELERGLVALGAVTTELAKSYIGHEHNEWPPLAPSTIEQKERLGYAVPAPLLREGILRESIKPEVDPIELELVVGSEDIIAVYQEMGTSRGIPPRPFLSMAMEYTTTELAPALFEKIATQILTGKRP